MVDTAGRKNDEPGKSQAEPNRLHRWFSYWNSASLPGRFQAQMLPCCPKLQSPLGKGGRLDDAKLWSDWLRLNELQCWRNLNPCSHLCSIGSLQQLVPGLGFHWSRH